MINNYDNGNQNYFRTSFWPMTKIVKKTTKNAGEDVGERYLRITSVLSGGLKVGVFTPVIRSQISKNQMYICHVISLYDFLLYVKKTGHHNPKVCPHRYFVSHFQSHYIYNS